jgi:hypothetical protein
MLVDVMVHVGVCLSGWFSADGISKVSVQKGNWLSVSTSMERVGVYGVQMVE